jgi:four helix bundle protein
MTNDQFNNVEIINNDAIPKRIFDLEERTALLGEKIIAFARKIHETAMTRPLISQLVRAATSIGANYCEADDALTRKEFFYKIGICRKESRETKHWLRMAWVTCPDLASEARILWQEAQELNLIFSSIGNKSKMELR